MEDAYVVDAVRTPFGKHGGSFSDTHAQDLAAEPLRALERRNGFVGSEDIDDVILGCVTATDEQGMNIGRIATMVSGWGDSVPGVQLSRECGSGQQAITYAAADIRGAFADVVIAGGTEHMTRVPILSNSPGSDNEIDRSAVSSTYFEHFEEITTQGEGAERIAEQWEISREAADEIAVDSHERWRKATQDKKYDEQVVPVETEKNGESVRVTQDEHPRPGTSLDDLADLPLVFREKGNGVVHAGNASGIVDGSAATLVASETALDEFGWQPMARIVDAHVVGVDPETMLTGPIPATREILDKNDMTVSDIDRFEVNEAFAPVINAWLEETGADWEKTNVWGGAIAHGHPLGATGAALLGKLPYQLEECGGRYALSTMCIGFGQGIATIIERV